MRKESKSITEFSETLNEHLFDKHPDMAADHTVTIRQVTKNNGVCLHGLTISENDVNIAPTIYIDQYYADYLDGLGLEEITERIINTYLTNRHENVSLDFFTDFESAKDRLAMKVINAEKNVEMLKDIPHYRFGDLAAIFQVQVDATEFGNAVITVKNEHLKMWAVTIETLMEHAMANMDEKQPVRIQSMVEVMSEMMGDNVPEEMLSNDDRMYVMTNESRFNGAAAMIFTDKLDEFAQNRETNLYILPSSIHEILLIPDTGGMDVTTLETTVKEVNETQVAPDEILSDNVYYYDRDTKTIYIAATHEPCILKCCSENCAA